MEKTLKDIELYIKDQIKQCESIKDCNHHFFTDRYRADAKISAYINVLDFIYKLSKTDKNIKDKNFQKEFITF